MQIIHIITLGKLKETYWREAEAEYMKRLSPYTKIQIHELREESFDEKSSVEMIKEKEASKIIREIAKLRNYFVIILDERGKQYSSADFAKQLSIFAAQQSNNFIFIIGGPLGLHESILKLANLKLSLSAMTFTHQMVRVFLLEQIYRAAMIAANRKYHY